MLSSPNALLALKFLVYGLVFVMASRMVRAVVADQTDAACPLLVRAVAGGFIGAKLIFWLGYPRLWLIDWPEGWWTLAAGNSVPGALVGAWIGLHWGKSQSSAALADALLPVAFTGMLILDMGAFVWALSEPGFGSAARHWGMNFGDGMLRHPVMLYDAACLFGFLWMHRSLGAGAALPGWRASLLLSGYLGVWMLLAFLKPPFGPLLLTEQMQPRPFLLRPGLTLDQWLCLIAMLGLAWRVGKLVKPAESAGSR